MDTLRLSFQIAGDDFSQLGHASGELKHTLKRMGFPPEFVRRTAIAMYEGETNMVLHAGGGQAEILICSDSINITLSDRGPGIADIPLAMQAGYSTASDRVRSLGFGAGMGLPNIQKYADRLDITSAPGEGTTLNIQLILPAVDEPEAAD